MHRPLFMTGLLITLLLLYCGCAHRRLDRDSEAPQPETPGVSAEARPSEADPNGSSDFEATDTVFDDFEDEFQQGTFKVSDPIEPLNRAVFVFNDRLYFWGLKPLAQGYNAVFPKIGRKGVRNFFSNLFTPVRFANCVLQGKGQEAGTEVVRFITNTSLGVLGLWDPALDLYDIPISDQDFGLTLGAYGIGNGFYIVWPIFGPSTLRDSVGWVGDALYTNPLFYIDSTAWTIGLGAYRRFNDLSFRIGEYEAIKQASIDPYTAVRDGYVQFRNALLEE